MNPSIGVVTLALADLERALAFYRDGLGLARCAGAFVRGSALAWGCGGYDAVAGEFRPRLVPRT